MSPNSLLLERLNIAAGFIPVNLATAANDGDYVNLKGYRRCAVVLYKGAGVNGEDPTLTIQQATSAAGGGAKSLTFTTVWTKQGADLFAIGSWTKVTQAAANTYTQSDSGEAQAIWVVEFAAADLDADNGFTFLRATVADVGATAQIGALLYLLADPVHPDKPENMLTPIA